MPGSQIETVCREFLDHYRILRPLCRWDFTEIVLAAAGLFTAEHAVPDAEKIRACRKILRGEKGIFSNFRGVSETVILCRMSMQEDPAGYLDRVSGIYGRLRRFFSGEPCVLAAMILAGHTTQAEEDEAVRATKEIYQEMRRAHSWMTSENDMPFAALMALTGREAGDIHAEAEACYRILRETLPMEGDARQTLSHILSLYGGSAEEKCEKAADLADRLRYKGHPLGRGSAAVLLGTLAASPLSSEELAEGILEAEDCLRQEKPFRGIFGIGGKTRRMFAVQCMEIALSGSAEAGVVSDVSASVQTEILLEMLLLLICISAVYTSHSASYSSK